MQRTGYLSVELPEMCRVAPTEFFPGVGVALTAKMLERIRRRDSAEPARHFEIRAGRQPLEEAAAEGVAHPGRIDDVARRHRGDGNPAIPLPRGASGLAPRDDQDARVREHRLFVEPRFLSQQFEFVIVADDDGGSLDAVAQLVAAHPCALLTR